MQRTTLQSTKRYLQMLLSETKDPEVIFHARTALQLLEVHDYNLRQLVEQTQDPLEFESQLRKMGYLKRVQTNSKPTS